MRQALAGVKDGEKVARQAQIVNELLASRITVQRGGSARWSSRAPHRRAASSSTRAASRSVGQAIQREIASADRIDLLCAFIKWHDLRTLQESLDAYLRSGRGLRVITTTYVG